MDPVACVLRAKRAQEAGDTKEVSEAIADLDEWIRSGGFISAPVAEEIDRLRPHRYHLQATNKRTGYTERVTKDPCTLREVYTIRSKFRPHRDVQIDVIYAK